MNLFQTPCLCCYLISLDLLVDGCSGFHWCDGGPKSGMSAVGRGGRERGWLSLKRGELSVLKTCLLVFQRVLFIRLRERDGFKISLIALWAALVDRIQLLRPGRSSPNFSFWVKWTSVAFHCFTA